MTEIQKRWLLSIGIVLLGLLIATDFHPDHLVNLPLWTWGVLLLLVGLAYTSWLWLRPGQWKTTRLRYGLAYGSYFGLSMFLLQLIQDAAVSAPAWEHATFMGFFCAVFMGLIMGASYKPLTLTLQRNSHGS
ncbi:hypothetical protein MF271_13760 [Deinococcus sp. KNUC1210]|uniref:hypothetical protein n=1 Tax=Deinococcus sp. KNUC1210 TaxID=2917691 RepID=UPI001EEFE7FD|nr:hypothetical protein [Deinococcus sp. KNUC1210]ULH15016.1 hypothetical protein MF271_13760 [Deinococcus sp. KNUC1210]